MKHKDTVVRLNELLNGANQRARAFCCFGQLSEGNNKGKLADGPKSAKTLSDGHRGSLLGNRASLNIKAML